MVPNDLRSVATPSVLVDLEILERNIARMAALCRDAGVRLRPHVKTHKSIEIGRQQLAAGARGLSVAKLSEAEVFVAAGCDDVFVAYPVIGAENGARLLALIERARVAIGVDGVAGARTVAEVFHSRGRVLDVLLKIDVGLHRVGVPPEQARGVAEALDNLPGLRLRGLFTFAGHVYGAGSRDECAAIGRAEGEVLAGLARDLRQTGLPIEEVSVGSTPTAPFCVVVPGVTEVRPGNYVFHDASQVNLGACAMEDCALTVLATVVSVPAPGRAVIDAGSKTLSRDPLAPRGGGFGWILGRRSRVETLTEEHGVVAVAGGEAFHVGERVRVLPNHCCVVVNLFDRLFGLRGEVIEAELPVAARGCVT